LQGRALNRVGGNTRDGSQRTQIGGGKGHYTTYPECAQRLALCDERDTGQCPNAAC
jgi:hypothetical protein